MTGILRRCVALLCSAAVIGALAGAPAHAEDFARVDHDPVPGLALTLDSGEEAETALFGLRVADHDSVRAYAGAVDGQVRDRTAYVEAAWSESFEWPEVPEESDHVDRTSWIVSHSYPHVALPSLAEEVELDDLGEEQAIAATQAAIWHVLDGIDLDRNANDEAVLAVYDHLVLNSVGAEEVDVDARSLNVSPAQVEQASPDEPLGPLSVDTTGTDPVQLSLRGAPESWLVDASGEQVTDASDGDEVYLDVDPSVPSGVATLHAHGHDLPLSEGRLFTGRDGVRTQPLITAEGGRTAGTTTATLTWYPADVEGPRATEEPTPAEVEESVPPTDEPEPTASPEETATDDRISGDSLAGTGTWLSGLLIIAGALVVSGLIILVLGRKKNN